MPRNVWIESVHLRDVFHDESRSFPERRDVIVARIKRSSWYKRAESESGELFDVIDELADAESVSEFDCVWNYVYDIADADRVWLATI